MRDAIDFITRRRSIRRYQTDVVEEEKIRLLLEAAMAAPSADNMRPWHFVVVRDAKLRSELSRVHRWAKMAADAPVVFVVLGDATVSPDSWIEDCSAATENLLLAAANIGLGAVWVGLRGAYEQRVRELVEAPTHMRVLCMVPVGYPAEEKPARSQYEQRKVRW